MILPNPPSSLEQAWSVLRTKSELNNLEFTNTVKGTKALALVAASVGVLKLALAEKKTPRTQASLFVSLPPAHKNEEDFLCPGQKVLNSS